MTKVIRIGVKSIRNREIIFSIFLIAPMVVNSSLNEDCIEEAAYDGGHVVATKKFQIRIIK